MRFLLTPQAFHLIRDRQRNILRWTRRRVRKQVLHRLQPQYLMVKNLSEVAGDGVHDSLQIRHGVNTRVDLQFKTRNLAVHNAAGNDQIEVAQIGCHVERKAVRGDTARNMHAERGNFLLLNSAACRCPHARSAANSLCADAILPASADQNLFKLANIVDSAEARIKAAQIEDGIADELSGAVIGYIATTIDL